MDASFGTTPVAMAHSIRLMERGLVNPEHIISHRFPPDQIHEAVRVMGTPEKNKVMLHA
jgi:threonine dehydrogenase-like Zn-dependent dehydrogenase